jgi:hypothetical protein
MCDYCAACAGSGRIDKPGAPFGIIKCSVCNGTGHARPEVSASRLQLAPRFMDGLHFAVGVLSSTPGPEARYAERSLRELLLLAGSAAPIRRADAR